MIPFAKRLAVLETPRLSLQPLTAAEADDVFPLMEEADIVAFSDVPETDDPDEAAAIVAARVAEMERGAAMHWSIRALSDGGFLGLCDLAQIDPRRKHAEVGFTVRRHACGQAYAEEAMQAVLAYAAAAGLRRLSARTQLGARRSEAVLETFGFQEEGLLRGQRLRDGERRDCRRFGLLL